MERVSSGTILLGFIAILCGLLGVYALRTALKPRPKAESAPPVQITIPMASRDLEPGHKVSLGDVALVRMTRAQMKERGIQGVFMSDADQIIGRTLQVSIERGLTFDTEDFYPDGVGPGIASRLNDGERAVTVSIFGADALVGFAGAGQVVDVLFKVGGSVGGSGFGTRNARSDYDSRDYIKDWQRVSSASYYASRRRGGAGGRYQGQAVTLMQGVRILAIESNAVETQDHNPVEKEEPIAITLAVSPDQAEVLRVVEGAGEISLSLRNPDDQTKLQTIDPRTLDEVLGIREEARPRSMEVYRGHTVNRLIFEPDGALLTRYDREPQGKAAPPIDPKQTSRLGETQPTASR